MASPDSVRSQAGRRERISVASGAVVIALSVACAMMPLVWSGSLRRGLPGLPGSRQGERRIPSNRLRVQQCRPEGVNTDFGLPSTGGAKDTYMVYSPKQITCSSESGGLLQRLRTLAVASGLGAVYMLMSATSCADTQLKDCFTVYKEARQSRETANKDCCTGTFDDTKKNSRGWVWHERLNLYVDKSKCDYSELRRNLIENLKGKRSMSKEGNVQKKRGNETIKSQKMQSIESKAKIGSRLVVQPSGNYQRNKLVGLRYTYGNASKANFESADLRGADFFRNYVNRCKL